MDRNQPFFANGDGARYELVRGDALRRITLLLEQLSQEVSAPFAGRVIVTLFNCLSAPIALRFMLSPSNKPTWKFRHARAVRNITDRHTAFENRIGSKY
ncbi:MAG: hypothetical protein O3B21_06240 [Proteobacteria bacterium]|nr:hypothetical protein [Pseudomonadota bacterium]MDA1356789.1 hypothetical protein [Pseudomonadota bacterium]